MLSIALLLGGIGAMALSGFPALLFPRRSAAGQWLTSGLLLAGSALGLGAVAGALGSPTPPELSFEWFLPWGRFAVAVDPLSAVFLALVFLVPALGSIYGLGYWRQAEHPESGGRLGIFFGLLAASMALVVISRDAVLFLIAWELMALSAYFAATADEGGPELRKAGWVYLVATHVGTLCLLAMFALWRRSTGSFALEPAAALELGSATLLFALAVVGFGLKAGIMPLHVWLPGAHANAPSHVSAVMSGVMLKVGIYGILRITSLLPHVELAWGEILLAAGAVTGLAGIAFAIGQSDLKRLLAYSSIENIGIITMGIGLALVGRALGHWDLVALGLCGALLHVWNHGLFKSLLFLDAGAIIHASHTRDLNRLGGLGKRMPLTLFFFVFGAVAICALPPLNGFVGEFLLYLGFFGTLGGGPSLAFAAAAAVALSMIGALAVAAFVKLLGSVFLGERRGPEGEHAHDPSLDMLLPMSLLAAGCLTIGLLPGLVLPTLERAAGLWSGEPSLLPSLADLAPLPWLSFFAFGLLALSIVVLIITRIFRLSRRARSSGEAVGTWDCGYAEPNARMQYTGSSFGQNLVRQLSFTLWPRRRLRPPRGPFPGASRYETGVPDLVLDRLLRPLFVAARRYVPRVRVLQQGQTHLYLLYIVIITAILLILGVGQS